jgi:two-component system nitrogen regulation response regulator GlnG
MAPTQVIEVNDLPPELKEESGTSNPDWLLALGREAERLLARGEVNIMEELSRKFEKTLIVRALAQTGGRRIEAANLLGIGRNTITRKISELDIEGDEPAAER